jgi:hypothetical protein
MGPGVAELDRRAVHPDLNTSSTRCMCRWPSGRWQRVVNPPGAAPPLVRIQPCTLGLVGESGRPRRVVSAETTGSNPVGTAPDALWFNGRTPGSDPGDGGSSPPGAASILRRSAWMGRPVSSHTNWSARARLSPPLSPALEGPRSTKPQVGGSTPSGGIQEDVAKLGKMPARRSRHLLPRARPCGCGVQRPARRLSKPEVGVRIPSAVLRFPTGSYLGVAQLEAHRLRKPGVAGSSPASQTRCRPSVGTASVHRPRRVRALRCCPREGLSSGPPKPGWPVRLRLGRPQTSTPGRPSAHASRLVPPRGAHEPISIGRRVAAGRLSGHSRFDSGRGPFGVGVPTATTHPLVRTLVRPRRRSLDRRRVSYGAGRSTSVTAQKTIRCAAIHPRPPRRPRAATSIHTRPGGEPWISRSTSRPGCAGW